MDILKEYWSQIILAVALVGQWCQLKFNQNYLIKKVRKIDDEGTRYDLKRATHDEQRENNLRKDFTKALGDLQKDMTNQHNELAGKVDALKVLILKRKE